MPRFESIAEITDIEDFNAYFTDYLDEHPLDFNALDEFLKQYVSKEKEAGPAFLLKQYVDRLRVPYQALRDDEDYDAHTAFERLKLSEDLLYNFLEKYGFDLSSNPLIESLADLNSQLQLLGMVKGSIDYVQFYKNGKEALRVIGNNQDALKEEIGDFCKDLEKDDLEHDTLFESFEQKKADIENLKKTLKEDDKAIENYKLINIRFKELSDKINNNPELIKNQKYETFFGNLITAFDYQKKPELSDTDKLIEETQTKISMLETQIEVARGFINGNLADSMNYREAVSKIDGMIRQKEMADKKITSDKLLERHNSLQESFGDLAMLSITLQNSNISLAQAIKKDANIGNRYNAAKQNLIDNFSDDPDQTVKMKQIFSFIEKDPAANAIDLLVVDNIEAFKAGLDNLKNDARQLQFYEETVKLSRQVKDKAFGVEKAKADIGDAQKKLEESKAILDKALRTRENQRKEIIDRSGFPIDDVNKVKNISNSEFYTYLTSKKNEYAQKNVDILNNGPVKGMVDELKKISEEKSLHTLDDLEAVKRHHEYLLKKSEMDVEKIEKHIETRNKLKDRMDDLAESADKVYRDFTEKEHLPNKYKNLKESLVKIKDRLGKLKKGSSNTSYYDNMYRSLNEAIVAVKGGNEETISSALTSLGNDTNTYISEKAKQNRPFPSALRKLRLNAAADLQKICNSKDILKAETTAKKACDLFVKTHKVGQSDAYYDKLKNKVLAEMGKQVEKTGAVKMN